MKREAWKNIKGWSMYQVSNLGRVRSFWKKRVHICKGNRDRDGYRKLLLYSSPCGLKRTFKFATLVALAFLGKRPKGKEVTHKNGRNRDDRSENLIYKTHKQNIADKNLHGTMARGARHGMAKLTTVRARAVKHSKLATSEAARKFNTTPSTICDIRKGRTWMHIS